MRLSLSERIHPTCVGLLVSQDFSIQCGDKQWMDFFPIALCMVRHLFFTRAPAPAWQAYIHHAHLHTGQVVVYPIGIPALFFAVLYRNRERLLETEVE